MSAPTLVYQRRTLGHAALAHRVALASAADEYERMVRRADEIAARNRAAAEAAWAAAAARARESAAARRKLWEQHRGMDTPELVTLLRRHEFHLSEYCRPYRTTDMNRESTWFVRMIRNELRRRGWLS